MKCGVPSLKLVAALYLALCPATAWAQSAIAGLVTDTSGGVLPGVTVEAASPALIEKVRTVVTDNQGRYTVVDLRPGIYKVTFTVPGFGTVVRDGVELPSGFTATVNVELRVGALEETVTVSGQAPVVDVHSVERTQVLTKDVADVLPAARIWRIRGLLLPGVSASGGTRPSMDLNVAPVLATQGGDGFDSVVELEGIPVTTLHFSTHPPYNEAIMQEVVYQTSALPAEVSRGGVRVNLIGKDGGNLFSGGGTFNISQGSWQASNLTPELIARKLGPQNHLRHSYDFNPYAGGPLKRDKLWLFGSYRWQEHLSYVARTKGLDGGLMSNEGYIGNYTARLTWQAAPKHQIKITGDYLVRPLYNLSPGMEWAARHMRTVGMYYMGTAKWNYPMTNKVMFEAGYSWNVMGLTKRYQPGVEQARGTPEWYAKAARWDIGTGVQSVAAVGGSDGGHGVFFPEVNYVAGSMTYVTGTHNFKAGVQVGRGSILDTLSNNNADLNQIYVNGVPSFVDVLITPWERREHLVDLGIYAQDSWTIRRLTINPGLRFDYFDGTIDPQSAAAGRFMPARSFPQVTHIPQFGDVVPRFSVSYDLFGDGRTAIKAAVSKYMAGYLMANPGSTPDYNPMAWQGFTVSAAAADRRDWNDRDRLGRDLPTNGDNIAQDNEIGPSNNLSYGLKGPHRLDPNFTRPYSIEYAASVDREVRPGLSVSLAYQWRPYRNLLQSVNQLVSLSDYTAFQATSPLNGEPITIYNLNREKQGQVDLLDRNSDINTRTYTGVHLSVNVRLPRGGTVTGGWSAERTIVVSCDTNNPNQFRFCDQSGNLHQEAGATTKAPFRSNFKLLAAIPGLPFGFTGGAALKSYQEGVLSVNWVVPASVFPGGQRTQPVTVPLIAPNTKYLQRWTQLDLTAKRTFRVRGVELVADLTVFNVINSSVVLGELQTFGPSLGTPTEIMSGRVPRIGLQMRF